jgi:hypothetical protein
MQPHNVWVTECRNRTRFAQEPFDSYFVIGALVETKNLESNATAKGFVFGKVDRPHPTLTEHIQDDVLPELKSLVTTGEQLPGLKWCEQTFTNQHLSRLFWLGGQVARLGQSPLKG